MGDRGGATTTYVHTKQWSTLCEVCLPVAKRTVSH